MEILDSDEYGAFSPKWMIKQAARHVPRENLEAVFSLAIEYLDGFRKGERGLRDPDDILDMLGQGLLTGRYVQTAPFSSEPEYSLQMTLADDAQTEETPGQQYIDDNPITREEIEQFLAELEDAPETEEPT